MEQLDKWQQEIERLSFFEENAVNKKLFKYYRQALIDIKKEMKAYIDNYETLSFSKRLEAEKLLLNAKQIDKILRDMNGQVNYTIEKYVHGAAERGYYGTWYAMEGAHNVQLQMNMLPEQYIKQLVHRPIKGQVFSKRLYNHTNKLAEQVNSALLHAARTGQGYEIVAKNIAEMTEATYKRALRIARTEGGRVQSTAKQRSYAEAKKKGVDLQKKWLATLDKKTRDSHQYLDGQVVEVEDKFETSEGHKAEAPRLFNVAEEDIHCRCTTITVVNGFSPEVRRNNTTKDEFPYKSYDEWYNKKKRTPKTVEQPSLRFTDKIKGNMPDNHQKALEGILNKAPLEVKELWEQVQDKLVTIDSNSRRSYYASGKGVHFNAEEDGNLSKRVNRFGERIYGQSDYSIFFHEFGHHIDDLFGYDDKIKKKSKVGRQTMTYDQKVRRYKSYELNLSKTLKSELKETLERFEVKNISDLSKLLKDEHIKDYPNGYAAVSDVISGLTGGYNSLGYGHDSKYWRTKDADMLGKEAFANMFQAYTMQGDDHKFMKKVFPKSYQVVIDFVKKGGKK